MFDVREELLNNADEKHRSFHSGLLPGTDDILGVRMPVLRNISKRICKEDWRSFIGGSPKYYEEIILKALVIANAEMDFDERFSLTKQFVPEINNWAVCDVFCGDWKIRDGPEKEILWKYCSSLMETDDEFKMRVAAVMMLAHYIDDDHIDDVLELMTTGYHDGYYYKMGAAWTLSYCYVRYPQKTEPLLFRDTLDQEIRNKAIQKISDSFRVKKEDKDRLKAKKKTLI